jgi:hypothetical protein
MTEREMIIEILKRTGTDYDELIDGTIEIYGQGYDRSINIEFGPRDSVIEIC